ncbi:uncharacterized protein LAJ45_05577 [Morchella importuna]|uniref:uncharacterized protein n=1 Tax=Morchella importuna TaxID=1174673 RepID=UPI001E8EEA09|nr:uncharacterized protein LAJ45_05577 [Morchella importuna]KAH8150366.1 hypothetical protein LAJ45_05577 [Morchella importuna]
MVLYKRKPVQYVPNPDIDDESQEVWQISQTGEVFVDYQDYLDRLDFYKTKQFSCEITGHMNLSFFEALISETVSSQDVDQTFPEALKDPVLRKVQFSVVPRIDSLVDQMHDSFKNDFYPGEHVTAILSNGDRVEALVREKTMFPELRYASGDIQRKGFSRYTVKLINRNDEEAQVDNEHLVRDKKSFTKAMLRSFIKNTVSREPWNGAPWIVKDEFAVKYKIPQVIPPELRKASSTERKAAHARRKQGSTQGLATTALASVSSSPITTTPVDIKPAPKSHKSKSQQAAMKMTKLGQNGEVGSGSISVARSSWSGSPVGTPDVGGTKISLKTIIKEETPPPPPPPPKAIKYPIEDLDLPIQEGTHRPTLHFLSAAGMPGKLEPNETGVNRRISRSSTRNSLVASASPAPVDNGIDEEKVGYYLSTWVFLNIYCEPLVLDSFTFDDYIQALEYSSDEMECELFVEIHCSLLKSIVNEQGVIQAQLPDFDEDEDEEDNEDEEGSEAGSTGRTAQVNGEGEGEGGNEEGKMEVEGSESGRKSRGRSEEGRKHRADELFEHSDSWVQRLKVRDFKNGGWQSIIVGLLYQLSMDTRYSKDCEEILAYLTPVDTEPTPETVSQQYLTLNPNLRVMVLHLLSRLTHETRSVRDYMEECAEEMTKHRKEKIEEQRTRKAYLEELKLLEDERKVLLPDNRPRSPSPVSRQASTDADGDSKMMGADDDEDIEDDEDDEGDDTDRGRSLRRGNERANARKRKREEEKVKADAAAKMPKTSKQFQKVLKAIETIKAKIVKQEEKITSFDEDLRQADCARFKMMGRDRFWNKYWWFERNGMPFGGLPSSSTADSGYANAMIWVQGPDPSEREGFLVEEAGTKRALDGDGDAPMNGTTDGNMTVLERQTREEGSTTLTSPTRYGYIETVEEFEQLMSWLDIKGVREKKLKISLEEYRKHIEQGMRNRLGYLSGATDTADKENGRAAARVKSNCDPNVWRCLRWRNSTMVEDSGHTHFDQPLPRKTKKKGAQDKGVPLNRQGKPVSRQGDRYNF